MDGLGDGGGMVRAWFERAEGLKEWAGYGNTNG